jgi:hypothetical protein
MNWKRPKPFLALDIIGNNRQVTENAKHSLKIAKKTDLAHLAAWRLNLPIADNVNCFVQHLRNSVFQNIDIKSKVCYNLLHITHFCCNIT